MNFVVENKGDAGLESLKLDLVVFGTDGGITRRLITEMGPIRPMKTSVRAFLIDTECKSMGAILVNDVTACTPGNPPACLDALGLSSRVKEIRLYRSGPLLITARPINSAPIAQRLEQRRADEDIRRCGS